MDLLTRWESATQPRPTTTPTARGVLVGLGLFRVVTALWAAVVAIIDARSGLLARPGIAFAVLGPVLAWSLTATWLARTQPQALLGAPAQALDLALGAAVVSCEWIVYDGAHPLNFGATWQLAPVISTGVAHGAGGGLVAGLGLGLVNGINAALDGGLSGRWLATLSTFVLLGVAGAAAGGVMERLRHAEDEVAEARARERVARTLHDGVLQTLAAVQRRSDDPELVDLAARQDRELRQWLRGDVDKAAEVDLATRLRRLATELQRRDGTLVEVVSVGSPDSSPERNEALIGAIREAVTNSHKHGGADRITVFLDQHDDGVILCTVHDDGHGFDPHENSENMGMTHSMRNPIEAVGGTMVLRSRIGSGTEVEFRIPGEPAGD